MRPKPIQIDRALPEEICEHREWGEMLKVKIGHKCSADPYSDNITYPPDGECNQWYVGSSFVYDVIELAHKRAKSLEAEMMLDWDYLRIMPEVGRVEDFEGYSFDTRQLAPDQEGVNKANWLAMRIYARAYRLRPMSDEKAKIARGLIADILDDKITSDEAVATFNGHQVSPAEY